MQAMSNELGGINHRFFMKKHTNPETNSNFAPLQRRPKHRPQKGNDQSSNHPISSCENLSFTQKKNIPWLPTPGGQIPYPPELTENFFSAEVRCDRSRRRVPGQWLRSCEHRWWPQSTVPKSFLFKKWSSPLIWEIHRIFSGCFHDSQLDEENSICPTSWGLKPAILDGPSEGQIPSIEVQTHTLCFKWLHLEFEYHQSYHDIVQDTRSALL